MAEIPLKIKAEADTQDAEEALAGLSESVEGLTGNNEEAAESYDELSERSDAWIEAAHECAAAQQEVADATKASSDAADTSELSSKKAAKGLKDLAGAGGILALAYQGLRERQELFNEMQERAIALQREQGDAFIESASNAQDYASALAILAEVELHRWRGPAPGITGASESARLAGVNAEYEARQWAATHGGGRGGGGRGRGSQYQTLAMAGPGDTVEMEFGQTAEQAQAEADAEAAFHQHQVDAVEASRRDELADRFAFHEEEREIEEKGNEALERLRKKQLDDHEKAVAEEKRLREEDTQSALSWISASGQIADSLITVFGGKESDRLILKGIIAEGEGAAMLIGSLGANPQGYAKLAEGAALFVLASQVGSKSGGGGGGGRGKSAGYGGGGGQGLGGGATGGGGGSAPMYEVHNYYGLIRERDAEDYMHDRLERRYRRTGQTLRVGKTAS